MSVWKTYSSLKTQRADAKLQGTVTHIPPERLNDYLVRLHETADVYAFGILVWEILTGKRPYEGLHADVSLIHIPSYLGANFSYLSIIYPS